MDKYDLLYHKDELATDEEVIEYEEYFHNGSKGLYDKAKLAKIANRFNQDLYRNSDKLFPLALIVYCNRYNLDTDGDIVRFVPYKTNVGIPYYKDSKKIDGRYVHINNPIENWGSHFIIEPEPYLGSYPSSFVNRYDVPPVYTLSDLEDIPNINGAERININSIHGECQLGFQWLDHPKHKYEYTLQHVIENVWNSDEKYFINVLNIFLSGIKK